MLTARNDRIGAVCAVAALGLIAWLSVENQAIARCRGLIEAAANDPSTNAAGLAACYQKLGQAPG